MATLVPHTAVPGKKSKVIYIDHLKVILIVLVILHHTFIAYGAPGGWYYFQKTSNEIIKIPMTLFVAVNQSFFMGFFFFLSALFVPLSYNKKGPALFLRDRLIRLGIPMLFYTFILGPFMNYLVYYFGKGHHISFTRYLSDYDDWIDFGVLWFAAALLVFNLLYVLWRSIFKTPETGNRKAISTGRIIWFGVALGALSFLVRLIFPIGWILKPVGFQLGHFPQYIVMFIVGLIVANNNWMHALTKKQGKILGLIARLVTVVSFISFYILLALIKFPSSYFSGGFHWPALLYALWEQITGVAIMGALIVYGRESLDRGSIFLNKFSRSTFATYIFHPLVVICITLTVSGINIEPALKLLFVAPIAVICSFWLGKLIVSIPGVNKIV
jgi:hypothetical protein